MHQVILIHILLATGLSHAALIPSGLRINYMSEPLGLDREVVRFSWELPQNRSGGEQLAVRVVVAPSQGGTPAFDSGKIATSQPEMTNSPPSQPMSIRGDTTYHWWVEVWTAASPARPLRSANTTFTTGLVGDVTWASLGARWIRAGQDRTQMRKEFTIPASFGSAIRATLFVAACQYYTLYLDGARVGQQRLDGPWTEFYLNRSYSTHIIDPSRMNSGKHVLGLRVGQGFCTSAPHDQFDANAERSAILVLRVHGAGDQVLTVLSDGSWTSSTGPIVADSTYYGEKYDARLEQPGWATPNFTPSPSQPWQPVDTNFTVVASLKSQAMEPIQVVRELPAVSFHKVPVHYQPHTCADVSEGQVATVSCSGSTIVSVDFVDFGVPAGDCSSGLKQGSCGSSANLTQAVTKACVGQQSCTLTCHGRVPPPYPNGQCTITNSPGGLNQHFVEGDACSGTQKRTALNVTCQSGPPPMPAFKYVYDFGQEIAGVVRLTLPEGTPVNTTVTLKHAEALAHEPLAPADGSVYMGNLFWANPIDYYISKDTTDIQVYEPSFTYHGFRYVEVLVDPPQDLNAASLIGINLRTAVSEPAQLKFGTDAQTSNNLVQRLSNNSWWTEASALMSIPAGAAGRGERNGWTGDAAFGSESECFDFDTGAFFSNYLEQVRDAQGPNGEIGGGVPDQGTAPTTPHSNTASPFDPSWSAVFPVVAYNMWKYYNCTICIDGSWEGLALYYAMLEKNYTVSPTTYGKWGDWNPAYPEPRTPDGHGGPFVRTVSSITAATMVVQNIDEAAELSKATGREAEAAHYAALLPRLREKYHSSFFDPIGGVYGDATPTAFGAALWLGVTPPELLPAVVDRFVWQLSSVGYRMNTIGFIGVRYIFEALAKVNRTDVALRMLNVTEYPSFGYQITNNMEPATTLWESYDEPTMRQWVDESSRDHHYSASINTFLRKYLAGLDQPRGSSAWGVVKCRPEAAFFPTMLPMATAHLASHRGPVGCAWRSVAIAGLPTPPSPPASPPPVLCAITPMFTGALRGPSPMTIRCPADQVISEVTYARWGVSQGSAPWFCWGPQPPPKGTCETDVTAKIAPLCVGKGGCNLSSIASQSTLGGPCASKGTQQLIVRVTCKPSLSIGQPHQSINPTLPVIRSGSTWTVVNITVPGGSLGEVHVPVLQAKSGKILESGLVVWQDGAFVPNGAPGVSAGGADGRFVWFKTKSGNYSFASIA